MVWVVVMGRRARNNHHLVLALTGIGSIALALALLIILKAVLS